MRELILEIDRLAGTNFPTGQINDFALIKIYLKIIISLMRLAGTLQKEELRTSMGLEIYADRAEVQ